MILEAGSDENRDTSVIGLITDPEILRDLSGAVVANGGMLVCQGCADIDEIILGILVLTESMEAWPLCGSCLRNLPIHGALAS